MNLYSGEAALEPKGEDFQDSRAQISALRLLIGTDKVRWALDRKPERFAGRASDLKRFMKRVSW